MSKLTKLPPALPRGDRAGDGFTGNRELISEHAGTVTAAKSVEYSPAPFQVRGVVYEPTEAQGAKPLGLTSDPTGKCTPSTGDGGEAWRTSTPTSFAFPGGQLRQGTVCGGSGESTETIPGVARGSVGDVSPAASNRSGPQTVKIPAALLTPHHKAGTAGPQTNPPQGGGQLLSLADSSLQYRPATLTAGQITVLSANSVMPCGGVDSDTPGRTNSPTAGYSAVNGEESVSGNDCAIRTGTSPVMNSASWVQFPARMAPVWRFLCQ